ncbi:sensor histidine kinase [Paenibacillus sp. OAS669]|uniref:sensor histidine kinase n=1 Tax=Paenibacillus sp. OAS669 TaxID=2663821 RepID=UPI00178A9CE8|nr:ATP-binding protein [Paenibacillus sp. OAS669]MBE1447123.1 two-component system nitrate/nitrite sensor histidine kinase NarX [Paenibacillus sp. OAS669]
MSLRTLKWLTILVPPLIIGGFEYIRHDFLLDQLSMETGNLYITIMTLFLSYLFATWMFQSITRISARLSAEQAKRAVYEERERLAQELHDNIAQILFFLNVQLSKGQLKEARSAVSEIDHHLRQAIFNLRTMPEEGATFSSRLTAWIEEWSGITGIAVEQSVRLEEESISPAAEVKLFAIIREAFTNIRKHSEADHASIELEASGSGETWRLCIRDNGIGMDTEPEEASPKRYGLTLMRKHAAELGAQMTIQSAAGNGTTLTLAGSVKRSVPL